jgi:hypothetical protein
LTLLNAFGRFRRREVLRDLLSQPGVLVKSYPGPRGQHRTCVIHPQTALTALMLTPPQAVMPFTSCTGAMSGKTG